MNARMTERRANGLKREQIIVVLLLLGTAAPTRPDDHYQYDTQGKLSHTSNDNGWSADFTHDPAGNRIAVTISNPVGTLQLSSSSYSGGEAAGQRSVTVTVRRVGGSGNSASVNLGPRAPQRSRSPTTTARSRSRPSATALPRTVRRSPLPSRAPARASLTGHPVAVRHFRQAHA
jgi:YD repeat-containing protein